MRLPMSNPGQKTFNDFFNTLLNTVIIKGWVACLAVCRRD